MQTTQSPSTFAQIIDKLRNKSEKELKQFYMQLSGNDTNKDQNEMNNSGYKVKQIKKGKNGLDEVFGIWKDKNITLDSIREEAWQRTK